MAVSRSIPKSTGRFGIEQGRPVIYSSQCRCVYYFVMYFTHRLNESSFFPSENRLAGYTGH